MPGGGLRANRSTGVIDIDAEACAPRKNRFDKLGKEIGGLEGRLKNPKFAQNAPPEVVDEARANLAARQADRDRLSAARARLEELA